MIKTEKVLYTLGRLRGAYQKGVSAIDGQLSDEHAWTTRESWGPGVSGGAPKTIEQAMEYLSSWVYICASMSADVVSSVPFRLYATKKKKGQKIKWAGTNIEVPTRSVSRAVVKDFESRRGLQKFMSGTMDGVEEIIEHPLLDLIHNVNPFSNFSDLIGLTTMFMDLTGSAFWYLIKNKIGVPTQIWCIPAQFVTPIPGKTLDEWITGYRFKRGGNEIILPIEDVIPFLFPNPKNEMVGLSVVNGVAEAVYNNSQMNAYEAALFENKANIDGMFTSDATLSEPQVNRVREDYNTKFAGANKAGKRPILPPGMKFTPTAQTRQELSFVEGRRLTMMEITAGFNIPIALFDASANRANVEGAAYHHARYGVQPRCRKIEEHCNEKLVPLFGGGIFLAFDNPVPDDNQYLLQARVKQVGVPFVSIDEGRAEIGKEPLDIKGVSDVPMVPMGYGPVSAPKPEPAPQPVPPQLQQPEKPGKPGQSETDQQAEELAAKTWKALKERLGA
jgi:HK97 family phage portal protein